MPKQWERMTLKKAKMALVAAGLLGTMAVAAPAQAEGWGIMTLYYEDETMSGGAVGWHVSCLTAAPVEYSGGVWTPYMISVDGLFAGCPF
jgi:hypothetical protein